MDNRIDVLVGQRLRQRRRLLGYSQQALGAACGVTFQQIHKYESAVCRLSVVMLWQLANALEVEIGYFFVGLTDDLALDGRRKMDIHHEVGARALGSNPRPLSLTPPRLSV
ncbi:MAG: helix-turn-helix domain-containing protein [Caulobacterales bacterium]|jgi:transcriptional regulator with XRE-family HTH domain